MNTLTISLVAAAASALFATSDALAQRASPPTAPASAQPGWYIGAGMGTGKVEFENANYLTFQNATTSGFVADSSAPMGKVFAGLRLSRHLGMEAGYYYFDKLGATRTFDTPSTGTLGTRIRLQGVAFDLVGHLPVSQGLSLFGKVGVMSTRINTNADATGALFATYRAPDTKRTEINLKYGLGAEFAIARNWALRAEWEYVRNVGNRNDYNWESDLQIVSGSLIGKF